MTGPVEVEGVGIAVLYLVVLFPFSLGREWTVVKCGVRQDMSFVLLLKECLICNYFVPLYRG